MRALPWILGGSAGALVAYYWTRRGRPAATDHAPSDKAPSLKGDQAPGSSAPSSAATASEPIEPLPGRWVWPVGVWQGRKPEISDGFNDTRTLPSGQVIKHGGLDIMYRRKPSDPWRAGTTHAAPGWVMPDHRAVLAASDGVIREARNTPRGWSVIIDHAPNLASYYTHMSSLLVSAKQPVRAGIPLGIIGADPLDPAHLMHLHFELWHSGYSSHFDPQRLMASWEYLPDPGDQSPPLVARNARPRPRPAAGFVVPVEFHYRRLPRR